jgi:hypothetical protein
MDITQSIRVIRFYKNVLSITLSSFSFVSFHGMFCFWLCRGPLSAGSHSSRTSKAVIVGPNGIVLQFIQRVYIKNSHATIHPHGITKLLIEITVVDLNQNVVRGGGVQYHTFLCIGSCHSIYTVHIHTSYVPFHHIQH